jgi:competence ComEA-like helix-hairpin-helix protein
MYPPSHDQLPSDTAGDGSTVRWSYHVTGARQFKMPQLWHPPYAGASGSPAGPVQPEAVIDNQAMLWPPDSSTSNSPATPPYPSMWQLPHSAGSARQGAPSPHVAPRGSPTPRPQPGGSSRGRRALQLMLGGAAFCFAIAIAVLTAVFGSAPFAPGVTISSAGTAGSTIQVYVVGAVERPGVYTLSAGARIQQLLDAAGGALPDADMIAVNPAAPISDGEEVYIPRIGETPPGNIGIAGAKVNINMATAEQMQALLHISKTTADHIVAYRQSHGAFTSIAQLLAVPISQSIFDRIKDQVTI